MARSSYLSNALNWLEHPTGRTAAVLALHSASLFMVVILLARFVTADALGHYVLGYAIGAPVFMFLNARQRLVLVNQVGNVDPTWELIHTRLTTACFGVLGITLCSFWLWGEAQLEKAVIVSLVAATKGAEAVSDIVYGGLQRIGSRRGPLTSIAQRAWASMLACAVVVPLTESTIAVSACLLVVWAGSAALDLRRLATINPPSAATARRWQGLWQTAVHPLAMTALLVSLAYYVPRYFLNATAGDAALGIFGALSYLGLVVQMMGYAVADSLMPGLAKQHQAQLASATYLAATRRLYGLLIASGAVGALTLLVLGNALLPWLLGPQFAGLAPLAALLLAAGALMAITSCQAHAMVALGLHKAQLASASLAFAFLVAASALLIPTLGMTGAAVSDLVYGIASVLITEAVLWRRIKTHEVTP